MEGCTEHFDGFNIAFRFESPDFAASMQRLDVDHKTFPRRHCNELLCTNGNNHQHARKSLCKHVCWLRNRSSMTIGSRLCHTISPPYCYVFILTSCFDTSPSRSRTYHVTQQLKLFPLSINIVARVQVAAVGTNFREIR